MEIATRHKPQDQLACDFPLRFIVGIDLVMSENISTNCRNSTVAASIIRQVIIVTKLQPGGGQDQTWTITVEVMWL